MLTGANRKIEQTIREIREAEAEKEKTREVRKELESFREHMEVEKGIEEKQVEEATGGDPEAGERAGVQASRSQEAVHEDPGQEAGSCGPRDQGG